MLNKRKCIRLKKMTCINIPGIPVIRAMVNPLNMVNMDTLVTVDTPAMRVIPVTEDIRMVDTLVMEVIHGTDLITRGIDADLDILTGDVIQGMVMEDRMQKVKN